MHSCWGDIMSDHGKNTRAGLDSVLLLVSFDGVSVLIDRAVA